MDRKQHNTQRRLHHPAATRGITLLELLVVMVILLMVTAAAIPIMAPALRNRQMREATRLLSAFMGAAKARAVQTGRPVGVLFERTNGQPYATTISQVEVPPPYSGDTLTSQATSVIGTTFGSLSMNTQNYYNNRYSSRYSAQWFFATMKTADFNARLIRVGDQNQFNGQGPLLTILGPDQLPTASNGDGVIDDDGSGSVKLELAYLYTPPLTQTFPWNNVTVTPPVPQRPLPQHPAYRVFRQPVRSAAQPLNLPEGIVVDLTLSSIGSTLFNTAQYSMFNVGSTPPAPQVLFDPAVIFSPTGRLEWVTQGTNGQLLRPQDDVYFLLGRRELMYDVTARNSAQDIVFQNLSPVPNPANQAPAPAENFWLTVGAQTGQVSVTEIGKHIQDYNNQSGSMSSMTLQDVINLALNGDPMYPANGPGARYFARQAMSVGGR